MSEWQNFQSSDAYHSDLRLGLYEIWLSGVEFGPTQADRVLIHSPMLEQAHERRFVVSEMGLDYSNFQKDHLGRIDYLLSTLTRHFHRHHTNEVDDAYELDDKYLLGMPTLMPDAYHSGDMSMELAEPSPPRQSSSQKIHQAGPFGHRDVNGSVCQAWPPVIDVDEDSESLTSMCAEYCHSFAYNRRYPFKAASSRIRQTVRMRKPPLRPVMPEVHRKAARFEQREIERESRFEGVEHSAQPHPP